MGRPYVSRRSRPPGGGVWQQGRPHVSIDPSQTTSARGDGRSHHPGAATPNACAHVAHPRTAADDPGRAGRDVVSAHDLVVACADDVVHWPAVRPGTPAAALAGPPLK